MATRSDIEVDWNASPRIITVLSSSTEITVQDLVDTCRDLEDELVNLDNDVLISPTQTGGKQDLGAGLEVDISAQLVNAQVSFQNRTGTTIESGSVTTATTPSTSGTISLIDSSAHFITSGSSRQDVVVNWDDRSFCTILEVVSEEQINCTPLSGGANNDFGVGDEYDVKPVDQCSIAGGNLVAVDVTGSSMSSVFQTFGTQIVRTSSASATRVNQQELQFSSFLGAAAGVAVHIISGTAGTAFPIGTRESPVNNLADAKTILEERGLQKVFLMHSMELNSGVDFSKGVIFVGDSPVVVSASINPNIDVTNCEFQNLTISGTLDGKNTFKSCIINDINFVNGVLLDSELSGTITLGGDEECNIVNCYSGIVGGGSENTTIIDLGATGQPLMVRGYNGGLFLRNCTGIGSSSLDMSSGQVVLDSTIVSGSFTIRGISRLEDNSGPGAMVNSASLIQGPVNIAENVWDLPMTGHSGSNTFGTTLIDAAYLNGIYIDTANGTAGTAVGVNGTFTNPVDNINDATELASRAGVRSFKVLSGDLALTSSLTEWEVIAFDETAINLNNQNVNGSRFRGAILKGLMTGAIEADQCLLEDVTDFRGVAIDSGLSGDIVLGVGRSTFASCHSRVPGVGAPTLDFNSSGSQVSLRAYSGGITVQNMLSASNVATLEFVAGQAIVDSSWRLG
jgi:hypothetical protein